MHSFLFQCPLINKMTQSNRTKFPKLSKLFRSKSEQGFKLSPQQSPKTSPTAAPRRRFLRVVRDNECEGEEYENEHVVRRFSKKYWEQQMEEAQALQHAVSLPYDVNSEHTILKKNTSTESDAENQSDAPSPTSNKRAYFKEEVQVIEFSCGECIQKNAYHMHETRLYDSAEECSLEKSDTEHELEFKLCERRQRSDEFRLAKQNSFDEADEDNMGTIDISGKTDACDDSFDTSEITCDSGLASDVTDVSTVSDSGAQSDTSNCSNCDALSEPKSKKQKKRRLRFRVSLHESSNDSDKENDQLSNSSRTKSRSYPKSITKLLRSVHLQREKESERHSTVCDADANATR